MSLKPEEKFILSAVTIDPKPEELEQMNQLIPQIRDWDSMTKLAIENQMGPLLYKKIPLLTNEQLIPEKTKRDLKQAWLKTLSRSMVLIEHFKNAMEAFNTENIPVIALKGIYLSDWLYQEIGLRQFSDIDLLVKPEDGEKAIAVLSDSGYHPSSDIIFSESMKVYLDVVHFPPMIKNAVSIEIHTKIHTKHTPYSVDLNELWLQATPQIIHGTQALGFKLEHQLLHLCLHLDKHFISQKFQFTCFLDIANLLHQYGSLIDWKDFVSTCQMSKAEKHVYKYLMLSADYLGVSIPLDLKVVFDPYYKKSDKRIFLKFLISCNLKENDSLDRLHSIDNFKSTGSKLKYILLMFFPPKEFIMERYRLKSKWQLLLYYPYRFFVGIRLGVKTVGRMLKK